MKAIAMYVFSGSQTIGHLESGWDVDRVLEMTEDMDETNAYHFVRNYDIPIIKPSEWNNDSYISSLKNKYDLLFANPPCSGLSSINRNANVNNDINKHIYEVVDVIDKIKPKSFLIENAPTLVSKGLPILKDLCKKLSDNYRVTIITDLAGNHNVPMYRKRTLVVGWRRDEFKHIPKITCEVNNSFTVGDALSGLSNESPNMTPIHINDKYDFTRFYYLVKPGEPVVKSLCNNLDKIKDKLTEDELNLVNKVKVKYDKGGSVWDKSPLRLDLDGKAPSITILNQFNKKVFFDEDCDIMYINQSSGTQKITTFSLNEFIKCDIINKNNNMKEVELWQ